MSPKKSVDPEQDDSLGVLDETPSSDTTAIGLLAGTAQVAVVLPSGGDEDLIDDEVVDGEVVSDLIIDTSAVADADVLARFQQDAPAIVIELPAEDLPSERADAEAELLDEEQESAPQAAAAEVIAEIMTDAADEPGFGDDDSAEPAEPAATESTMDEADVETPEIEPADPVADLADVDSEADGAEDADPDAAAVVEDAGTEGALDAEDSADEDDDADADEDDDDVDDAVHSAPSIAPADFDDEDDIDERPRATGPIHYLPTVLPRTERFETEDEHEAGTEPEVAEAELDEPEFDVAEFDGSADDVTPAADATSEDEHEAAAEPQPVLDEQGGHDASVDSDPETGPDSADANELEAEAEAEIVAGQEAASEPVVPEPAAEHPTAAEAGDDAIDAPLPEQTPEDDHPRPAAAPAEETHPVATTPQEPMPAVRAAAEPALASRRIDDVGGAAGRESADLLTADRLLEPSRLTKPEPEGTWSHLLYSLSGGRINVGDSRKARERKELTTRISAALPGAARFVPVLSRKGGVGKTTVTALLGMALADARDDRVIAVDANPDRGTLAERVVSSHSKSVRDMVRAQHDIRGFHDISALVARDETRLDVLASDDDPRVSEAFSDGDYRDVAKVAAQYYSMVLTDSGTGIVHSVMGATLDLADQIVIVSGLSVDEARLASETLTWLETNGHAELAREAIVVLNQSTPGEPLVRLSELESHFSTRARHVLRVPYDSQIAGGGPIDFSSLQPETRRAAREIAATLVEGLRTKATR